MNAWVVLLLLGLSGSVWAESVNGSLSIQITVQDTGVVTSRSVDNRGTLSVERNTALKPRVRGGKNCETKKPAGHPKVFTGKACRMEVVF